MARKWFKFDATLWLGDMKLRGLSPAAKGVWIDILCLMHQSEERGVLITKGEPWTLDDVVKRVANGSRACRQACNELVAKDVMSVRQDGAFFSRRMVADETQLQADKQNGAKGGNPELTKGVNPPDKARAKSIDIRINTPISPFEIPDSLKPAENQIREWIAYKAERGKAYKPRGLKGLISQFTEWGPARTAAAIRHSIASNYDGVFEPRAGPGNLFGDPKPNPAHARSRDDKPAKQSIPLEEFAPGGKYGRPREGSGSDPVRTSGGS